MNSYSFSIRAIFVAIFLVAILLGLGRFLISNPNFTPPACLVLIVVSFIVIHLYVDGIESNPARVSIGCAMAALVYIFVAALGLLIWLYAAVSIDQTT